jgi:phosphate acetyltransferase
MGFLTQLTERAARERPRIAFPESHDRRILEAVGILARERIVEPVLVLPGDSATGGQSAAGDAVAPATDPRRERVVEDLLGARGDKGLTAAEARRMATDPLCFAMDLVRHGDVAGCVAGCDTTTAEVIRAALWLVGRAPDVRTVSSAFYMVPPAFRGAGDEVLTFADCGVVRYPTADQLADIAVNAVRDRVRVVGDEPVVGFLSFSTKGSAEGESVDLVREAVRLTTARLPDCSVDGELQADAALIEAIGQRKAPGSVVAGRANVLIFPSLDAGNIAYKLVERLAGAAAIGPILQGLARPCNDLSRGASVDDIIRTAAVTALQARRGESLEG